MAPQGQKRKTSDNAGAADPEPKKQWRMQQEENEEFSHLVTDIPTNEHLTLDALKGLSAWDYAGGGFAQTEARRHDLSAAGIACIDTFARFAVWLSKTANLEIRLQDVEEVHKKWTTFWKRCQQKGMPPEKRSLGRGTLYIFTTKRDIFRKEARKHRE